MNDSTKPREALNLVESLLMKDLHSAAALARMADTLAPMRQALETIEKARPNIGYRLPEIRMPEMPRIPTSEERNEYQSSRVLIQTLAASIAQWRQQLPPDQQP